MSIPACLARTVDGYRTVIKGGISLNILIFKIIPVGLILRKFRQYANISDPFILCSMLCTLYYFGMPLSLWTTYRLVDIWLCVQVTKIYHMIVHCASGIRIDVGQCTRRL